MLEQDGEPREEAELLAPEHEPPATGPNPYEAGPESPTIDQIEDRIKTLTEGRPLKDLSMVFQVQTHLKEDVGQLKKDTQLFASFISGEKRDNPMDEFAIEELLPGYAKTRDRNLSNLYKWSAGQPTKYVLENINRINEILDQFQPKPVKKIENHDG